MEKGKKRGRSVNFTVGETDQLISLVRAKKHIIEIKKSDAETWLSKEKAWKAIEMEFNTSPTGEVYRTAKNLKIKYESMKKDIRKKASMQQAGDISRASVMTPLEETLKEFLPSEGGDGTCDSELEMSQNMTDNDGTYETTRFYDSKEPSNEEDESDNSSNVIVEVPFVKIKQEYPPNKICRTEEAVLHVPPQPNRVRDEHDEGVDRNKSNTMSQSRKHPALIKTTERRPFQKLAEARLEIVNLQKNLIEEELEQNTIKRSIIEMELEQKKSLYEIELIHRKQICHMELVHKTKMTKLEEENMMLKNRILEMELRNSTYMNSN